MSVFEYFKQLSYRKIGRVFLARYDDVTWLYSRVRTRKRKQRASMYWFFFFLTPLLSYIRCKKTEPNYGFLAIIFTLRPHIAWLFRDYCASCHNNGNNDCSNAAHSVSRSNFDAHYCRLKFIRRGRRARRNEPWNEGMYTFRVSSVPLVGRFWFYSRAFLLLRT